MPPLTPAERLVEIQAIKQLKARYFRCVDERDWAGLAGALAEDIEFEHPTTGRHRSAAATLAALQERLGALASTVHHGSMPKITLLSPIEASRIWSLHSCVMVLTRPGGPAGPVLHGFGRYWFSGGEWRISSLRLVHLYKQRG